MCTYCILLTNHYDLLQKDLKFLLTMNEAAKTLWTAPSSLQT